MYPVICTFSILGREMIIASYGVLVVTAVAVSFFLAVRISRRTSLPKDTVITFCFVTAACGLFGAFITGVLFSLPEILKTGFYNYQPVIVSWGGILGGTAASLLMIRFWKIDAGLLADMMAPVYLLGIGIGRIGCFFGGCCYGVHTDSFIGVHFTDPIALASHSLQPLIPTQLISSFFLITGSIVFTRLFLRMKSHSGILFAASAVYYSLFRFTIEYWRDDPREFFLGFSDGQIFSMLFFCTGVAIFIKQKIFTKEK